MKIILSFLSALLLLANCTSSKVNNISLSSEPSKSSASSLINIPNDWKLLKITDWKQQKNLWLLMPTEMKDYAIDAINGYDVGIYDQSAAASFGVGTSNRPDSPQKGKAYEWSSSEPCLYQVLHTTSVADIAVQKVETQCHHEIRFVLKNQDAEFVIYPKPKMSIDQINFIESLLLKSEIR